MSRPRDDAWRARPVLAFALRAVAFLVPLLVSLGAALLLISVLPSASSTAGEVLWWAVVLGGAVGAALLTDRAARRLLPLSVLLQLALVFPDRAPSRLKTVRGTSVRALDDQLKALRRAGETGDRVEVAETLVTLVGILGLHDKRTRGHSERVRAYVDLLSEQLDLPEEDRLRVRWAALIHDLGKLVVPPEILNGGSDLTAEDWALLRRHPEEGARLAAGFLPWLGEWGGAVLEHHERWDGDGYPAGLAGEQICRGARIVAVADAYDVMTSNRSYQRAVTPAAARRELAACAGTQFDPAVVRAFLQVGLGRLTWVVGPLSWVSAFPLAAAADRAGRAVKAGTAAAAAAGLVVGGFVSGPTAAVSRPSAQGGSSPSPTPPAVVAPQAVTPSPPAPSAAPSPVAPGDASPAPAQPTAAPSPPVPKPATSEVPAPPTPSPAPSSSPSPAPSAAPSPTASPSPSPSASPTPSPTSAVPSTATYYLGSSGLSATAPTGSTPVTVTLLPGGGASSYDLSVPTGTVLSGAPQVALFVDAQRDKGSDNVVGQLTVVLQDCSGTCTDLATATVAVGGKGPGTQEETATLSAVSAPVLPGHVLRLAVALASQGNADRAVLSFGAAATPSRLDLTAAPPP